MSPNDLTGDYPELLEATCRWLVDDELDGELDDIVQFTITDTDRLWTRADGRVVLTASMVDGIVLTHRITAEEVGRCAVNMIPDLEVLDWSSGNEGIRLASGGLLTVSIEVADRGDTRFLLSGPTGWLDGIAEGDLVAFTRRGDDVTVEAVSEPLDSDVRELDALRSAVEDHVEPGESSEMTPILMEALATEPQCFRRPVRPVDELIIDVGLERRGHSVGRAAESWMSPGERSERHLRLELGMQLELCCRSRFERVCEAYAALRRRERVDASSVLADLRHGATLAAFSNYSLELRGTRGTAIEEFANQLIDAGRHNGAPIFLLGSEAERKGDVTGAEALYQQALDVDPDVAGAAAALARFEVDRGNWRRAVRLLSHDGLDPDDPLLASLRARIDGAEEFSGTGRNEPCPCGSGRKYKQCHLGRETSAAGGDEIGTVMFKTALFASGWRGHSIVRQLAALATDPDEPNPLLAISTMMTDPVIIDFAIWEGGVALEYLAQRGHLLPAAEAAAVRAILERSRCLYEVLEVDPGTSLLLRDTGSGDSVRVIEHLGSLEMSEGDLLLARTVPRDTEIMFAGSLMRVQLSHREAVMALLDEDAGAEALAEWYGASLALPLLSNREGDPLLLCSATLSSSLSEGAIREALASFLDAEEDGYVERFALSPTEEILRGTVRVSEAGIEIETNSVERFERLLGRIVAVVPDAQVVDYEEQDPRRMVMESRADRHAGLGADEDEAEAASGVEAEAEALAPEDPQLRQILDVFIRQKEAEWVDKSIPALGGLTPRQAADDPTRREDLLRLLAEFERFEQPSDGVSGGMDAGRLRALLGVGS